MRSRPWLGVLLCLFCSLLEACSSAIAVPIGEGPSDGDADSDGDSGGDSDADEDVDLGGDADEDADEDEHDAWVPPDSDIETPEDVPSCGDGVVDPGEHCDDHNRLNGDGCDWLCRRGDGEQPPTPDPAIAEYAANGEPVPADDIIEFIRTQTRLPLTWSGDQYATAYPSVTTMSIRFHRLDGDGDPLDTDWVSPTARFADTGCDFVWNGTGYGLFYLVSGEGVYLLRLDLRGKPLGDPVLVVPFADAGGRLSLAADRTPEGYVVAVAACSTAGVAIGLRLLNPDGSTEGLPEPLVGPSESCDTVDVATGEGGFGVSFSGDMYQVSFLQVGADLSEVVASGTLGEGYVGDVQWDGVGYVAAFDRFGHDEGPDEGYQGTCVARFSPAGLLLGPPVCSLVASAGDPWVGMRLAAGDEGLALVFRAERGGLLFLRADARGVPVGLPIEIPNPDPGPFASVDSVGVTWADEGFAVLYGRSNATLMLQRFVVASP